LWDQDDRYEGFEWIDLHDAENSVVSFLRQSRQGEIVVFVVAATPVVGMITVGRAARWFLPRDH